MVAAPAPAPKPAPAPARPPADSDGDGVIDANDKCPNTPKGARVGPQGCDCDVSVQLQFAFDSAKLTDSDKQELKRTAERLQGLNWISGMAEGHTDSIGSDAYNQSLSERRAQAVVDYMATLGIDASRMTVVGKGEADPVADNGTERRPRAEPPRGAEADRLRRSQVRHSPLGTRKRTPSGSVFFCGFQTLSP